MDKVAGSLETLSALQITSDTAGLDAANKELLKHKEVLAVILRDTVKEYKGYSVEEIIDFIEAESITSTREVSTGRTNTQVRGDNIEFTQLNEKTSTFDILVKAENPILSTKEIIVNLHIDLEPQKNYKPGYPVEKRGIYYLTRSLSSQLSLITDKTDYNELEKCYSIWICRDNIPENERYSISFYSMINTKNIGRCSPREEDYDLLSLVLIRLGSKDYDIDDTSEDMHEGEDVLGFLNAIMYPHQEDFMEKVSRYIDFSGNEELRQEVGNMGGLGESILEEGIEQGIGQGISLGDMIRLADLIQKKINKKKEMAQIADELEMDVAEVKPLYEFILQHMELAPKDLAELYLK